MAKTAIGIDIGGTGIKAGVVRHKRGTLLGERVRVGTPAGGGPADIAAVVANLVMRLQPADRTLPVGICFPAVVKDGRTLSAANISSEWIGLEAAALFADSLGQPVTLMNDADAAGVAEMRHGAGIDKGVVLVSTLGTGIGSALFVDGQLVPNTELGHLEIDGVDYETQAAHSAMEREGLSYEEWAARLQRYFGTVERLFSPDLIIVGGGVSKSHEKFLPLLKLSCPIVPAQARNDAGIIGAAMLAHAANKKGKGA